MKVGVIGLGQIGGGVAQCLARAGMLAAIYDVSSAAADRLEVGLSNGGSPRAVAEAADVVLIAVFDAAQARAVLDGEHGILAARRPEVTVVLLSTVALDDYHALRQFAAAGGVDLLDCGVTGGSSAARGGLVCLIGGTEAAVAKVRPALDGFSAAVYRMGGPGAGMAGKIARNVIVYGTWLAEYEAFKLAKAAGVDGAQLISVVVESRGSVAPPCAWPRRDPDFNLEVVDDMRRERSAAVLSKDLGAALDLAATLDLRIPGVELTRANGRIITGLEAEPSV